MSAPTADTENWWLVSPAEERAYRAAFLLGARVARALRMRGRVAWRAAESVALAAVPPRGPELFRQDDEAATGEDRDTTIGIRWRGPRCPAPGCVLPEHPFDPDRHARAEEVPE